MVIRKKANRNMIFTMKLSNQIKLQDNNEICLDLNKIELCKMNKMYKR